MDSDFLTSSTGSDYACSQVKIDVETDSCEYDPAGNKHGALDYHVADDYCQDRLLKHQSKNKDKSVNVDFYVNCVQCDATFGRCDCPPHHYLHPIVSGGCWPTTPVKGEWYGAIKTLAWQNIDRCKNVHQDQCGYLCLACPAGKYRFDTGVAVVDGNGANCVSESCCTVDETGAGESLDAVYEEDDKAFTDENNGRKKFMEEIDEAKKMKSTPRWTGEWKKSEFEAKVLKETAGPELAKLVDPLFRRDTGICGGKRSDLKGVTCGRDVQIKQTPCFLSEGANTMTLAFIPYSKTTSPTLRRSIYKPLRAHEHGDMCQLCQSTFVLPGSSNYGTEIPRLSCIDRLFNRKVVDNWCIDCDKVEKIASLVAAFTINDTDAGSTGDKITTYTSECRPYDEGASDRFWLTASEIGLVATSTATAGATGAVYVGLQAGGVYERAWQSHDQNELNCKMFLANNPEHRPKTIKCGQGFFHKGVEVTCTEREFVDVPASYYLVPEPTYTKSKLQSTNDVDVIPLTSDNIIGTSADESVLNPLRRYGLNPACVVNAGSWSINACEMLRRARQNFCFDFHDTIYTELGLSRNDILDYFDNLRTVEAHDRRAFIFYVANMPDKTWIETFTDTKCTNSKHMRSLHHHSKEFHLLEFGMQYDETIDETYMQEKWDVHDNSGPKPLYTEIDTGRRLPYEGGVPPIEFIVYELGKLGEKRPPAQDNEKSFRIHVRHDYVCECPPGQVIIPPDGEDLQYKKFFDQFGFMRCAECPSDDEEASVRYITEAIPFSGNSRVGCGVEMRRCVDCGYGEFPNAERTKCIHCLGTKIDDVVTYPLLDETTLERSCVVCNKPGFYHKLKGVNEEFDTCVPIPIMEVVAGETASSITISNHATGDMVVEDYMFPHVIRPIRRGHYLNLETRTEESCVDNREFDARPMFRRNCGMRKILVRDLSNPTSEPIEFDLDAIHDEVTVSEYHEIIREGDMTACNQCARYHYLKTPCTSEDGGFEGTCELCSYCEDTKARLEIHLGVGTGNLDPTDLKRRTCENDWLSHELATGCNLDGDALTVPTSDYVLEPCVYVQIDRDGAFLFYGCGTHATKEKWKCGGTNRYGHCDGWGEITADTTGIFKYGDPGEDPTPEQQGAMIEDEQNIPQPNSAEDEWRYVYMPYQRKVPYCPPKHFFFNDNGNDVTTFNPFNCALCTAVCKIGDLASEKIVSGSPLCGVGVANLGECNTKAQDFAQCPGFGLEDTQKRCTSGCDIGYYEKMVTYPQFDIDFPTENFERDGETKCVPCETCRF